jgi:hypothetical protein
MKSVTVLPSRILIFAVPCESDSEESVMADDLEQTIADNAAGPKRAKGDSAAMEQHSLPDQIAADRYLASKNTTKAKGLGIALKKLVPPGAD